MKNLLTVTALSLLPALVGCAAPAEDPGAEPKAESVAQPPTELEQQWQRWNDPELQSVEPFQIFDNLYYVGIEWVSAYLLTTSEGLILIDALYGDFVEDALDAIEQLGFDSADVRYVLVTHGHFDHAAGAAVIQERTGARVAMTEADWELAELRTPNPRFDFEPPLRDVVIADGDSIELGDTRIDFFVTPGHTEGVLSMAFDVRDGGEVHRAFCFGGVGLNFSGVERTEQYIASVQRVRELWRKQQIAVNVTNHAAMGQVFERHERLRTRVSGEPHAFVDFDGYGVWLEERLIAAEEKLEGERAVEGEL